MLLVWPLETVSVWPLLTKTGPLVTVPPLLTVPKSWPPDRMIRVPPLSTVVLLAVPPEAISSVWPLLTVRPLNV